MPPPLLVGAATPWPAIVVGVAAVAALSLWGMLREGSIAHRARGEDHADDGDPPADEGPPPSAGDHHGGDDVSPPGPRP